MRLNSVDVSCAPGAIQKGDGKWLPMLIFTNGTFWVGSVNFKTEKMARKYAEDFSKKW